jgi:hypothetical protein
MTMPTNTHVFTGLDGTISLAVDTGPEGDAAKAVNDTYSLTPIGRATAVNVQVVSEVKPFHELGRRYAAELRAGNINVSGTVGRAHVNGALLKLMIGQPADGQTPVDLTLSPTFNLSLHMENSGFPGNFSTVTVHSVKLDGWSFSMPEDDYVLEQVSFRALWVSVEDKGA